MCQFDEKFYLYSPDENNKQIIYEAWMSCFYND